MRKSTDFREISQNSGKSKTGPTLLADGDEPVDLVGFRDVQLGSLRNLLKLGTLVESTAKAGLPARRVILTPVRQLSLELRPRLQTSSLSAFSAGRSPALVLIRILTLKMAASSSLRKSCFPACFQGMRNMVLASSSHITPGYFPLLTWRTSEGLKSYRLQFHN